MSVAIPLTDALGTFGAMSSAAKTCLYVRERLFFSYRGNCFFFDLMVRRKSDTDRQVAISCADKELSEKTLSTVFHTVHIYTA